MKACPGRAILVLTGEVQGTSTTIVRQRIELRCGLPDQHPGDHHDPSHDAHWAAEPGDRPTLVRMENAND